MAKKSFKKFAGTGKLKAVINSRRAHQKQRKLIEGREKRKSGTARQESAGSGDEDEDEDDEPAQTKGKGSKEPKNVDDLLGADFMEGDSEDETALAPADGDEDDDASLADTDDSFGSLDDLDDMEQDQVQAMANLSKTDPEFYKYLQENDKELLEFGQSPPPEHETVSRKSKNKKAAAVEEEAMLEDGSDIEEYEGPATDDESEDEPGLGQTKGKGKEKAEEFDKKTVTMEMVRGWQKGMLQTRSLKSLRRLLLAFRAAAHSNEEGVDERAQTFAYDIEDPTVFNKVILASLKFTPIVLAHHIPFRLSPTTGRYKLLKSPAPALMKMLLSYMGNLLHLIGQLPDEAGGLLKVCLEGSAKMIPWVIGARKTVRQYLKVLLELWSSGSDSVRIACFLAIRKIVAAGDEGVKDMVLKGIYLSLLRSCKQTTIHTFPAINLMKNSASEIYTLDHSTAYQHAFGYIRQLAVHLRNSMRVKTKDSYKAVYNWQFVHCIDFWCLVLSNACSRQTLLARGGVESELQPLIYPLVQVTLGVIRLIPTSRYFPLRFHVIRSLLSLSAHTKTYIPLVPSLVEPLSSAEFTHKPKPSTLAPLDFEYHIRAPAAYPRTRAYQDSLAEEITFLLLESQALMSTSISFPEMSIPVVTLLKRFTKKNGGKGGKATSLFKVLIDKIETTAKWVNEKRKNVEFAPNDRQQVEDFLQGVDVETTAVGAYWKLQKKVRTAKRKEVEKAAREERGPEEDGSDDNNDEPEDEIEDEDEGEMEYEEDD